jgi:retron-type reverse transcriptase
MSEAQPCSIAKWEVWEASQKVKAHPGAAGVDGQSSAAFEMREQANLDRIWNRMASGSYFPPPVRTVKIPQANGGERTLGIPTVSERIAQMGVQSSREPVGAPLLQADS